MEFEYKIIEPHENFEEALIEKSGISTARFTLKSVQDKQKQWTDEKRQMEGQILLDTAKADNIAHHHPFVLEMSEQDQYTVWMYYEAMRGVKEMEKQVKLRVEALDEYQKEREIIYEQLNNK